MRVIFALLLLVLPLSAQTMPPMISDSERLAWQAVGRVNVGGFRSKAQCSGTLIAPDKVITAAHCVVNLKTGVPVILATLSFVAGWHQGDHAGASVASAITVHPGYPRKGGPRRIDQIGTDLAIITLKDRLTVTPVPLVGVPLSGNFQPGVIKLLGYRRDRPHILSDYQDCFASPQPSGVLALTCDVATGTSGAPVMAKIDGIWQVIAVVSSRIPAKGLFHGLAAMADPPARSVFKTMPDPP